MLIELIARYRAAKIVWEKQFDEDDKFASNSAEWHAYEDAGAAVIEHACVDMKDVRTKARFLLDNENAFDSVQSCYRIVNGQNVPVLAFLLRSFIGETPVDNGEN